MAISDLITSRYAHGDCTLLIRHAATLGTGWFRSVLEGSEYPRPPCLSPRPPVIVDIGANIGISTLYFALQYPEARIWALEPSKRSFECLRSNTAEFANVRAVNIGLHSSDLRRTLHHGQSCVTDSLIPHCHSTSTSETVDLRRASTFLSEMLDTPYISILKVDTEGCELPILQDLADWLSNVDCLFYEYHSDEDRVRLDCLLSPRFYVFHGRACSVHRGTVGMIAKRLSADHPDLERLRIGEISNRTNFP